MAKKKFITFCFDVNIDALTKDEILFLMDHNDEFNKYIQTIVNAHIDIFLKDKIKKEGD